MSRRKSLDKVVNELVEIKNQALDIVAEDPAQNITLISEDYEELDSPNKILETYLKILVSLLPSIELMCKKRPNEWSIRTLTTLGDALRQTITELEIYKNPEVLIDEKVVPVIQTHHDEVIRKIADHVSRIRTSLFELFPETKQIQAQNLLVEFLKSLGEDLRSTYASTTENIKQNLLDVRGL